MTDYINCFNKFPECILYGDTFWKLFPCGVSQFFQLLESFNNLSFSELPASKETDFRRRQSKDTGFEPAGSLFSCLSG